MPDAEVHVPRMLVLLDGIAFGGSPRWHEGRLWFADCADGAIFPVAPSGASEVMVRVPSAPLCFDFLPDGSLLVVAGGDKHVLHVGAKGTKELYADLGGLCDRPWGEIAVDSRGNAYVDNIAIDVPDEDSASGLIAVITPNGDARQVADGLSFPSGMALARDDKTLIVAEPYASQLTAFDVAADGCLADRRLWARLDGAAPDGICVDAQEAVWFADAAAHTCVRVKQGGHVLQTVAVDRGAFACVLGGPDTHTLFIMATAWAGEASTEREKRAGQVQAVQVDVAAVASPNG